METYTYDAFISYKQKCDQKIAKTLERNLEHYHIPSKLQKNFGKKNLKVFRDKNELRTTHNLSGDIQEALKNSKFLIVICSPEAKAAPWIIKEIKMFIKTHGNSAKNIITVISKGESVDATPDILMKNQKKENLIETLPADYRKRLNRNRELPRIIATLIDCKYDELIQRRKTYERRRIIFLSSIITIVCIVFTALYITSKNNKDNALREESQNLVFLSENAYDSHDRKRAIETALEALPSKGNKRPYIPEAKRALLTATEAYRFEETEMGVIRNLKLNVPIKEYAIYEEGNGTYIAILGKNTCLQVYNIKTGKKILDLQAVWEGHGLNQDVHIIMCEENQLLFWCSSYIASFDLNKKTLSWEKKIKNGSSTKYTNLLYNSDSIMIGLNSGEIVILNKKSGKKTDTIPPNKSITKTKDKEQMLVNVSTDSRYLICHNQSFAYLYDRKEMKYYTISSDLQSKPEEIDGNIMGDFCFFSYTKAEEKYIHILCYDIKHKKIIFEKEKENVKGNFYIPWFMPLENVTINGMIMNINISIIGNSMILIDCQSSKIIFEIQFTNRIQGAFLQKRQSSFSSIHDYGILSLGCDEDILTVIFENGECADYSFRNKSISESYEAFDNGVIHPEKSKNYFCISYKNKLKEERQDNIHYETNINKKTHEHENFPDSILIYGKRKINTDWIKITDDYDYNSNVYPYKNGFLIFQSKSCAYYDINKNAFIWENPDINYIADNEIELSYLGEDFWIQNGQSSYKYLGTDVSEQYVLIGSFDQDYRYKIQFLNGADGKIVKTDNLNLESFNDTSYKVQKISDFQNSDSKLFFSVKLEDQYGLIISYNLISGKYHSKKIKLKNSSAHIKIISISNSGERIFWCEQNNNTQYLDVCYQSAILDMDNGRLHQLELDENTKKNIVLTPNPCWSDDDQFMMVRSHDRILLFSQTGDCERTIETINYTFVGGCFFENILYVIGDVTGTPILFRYDVNTGNLLDSSELIGRNGFDGNTFNIKCTKSFDSEVIMILKPNKLFQGYLIGFTVGAPYHNAWIIDQHTGKSIAYIQQGAAYNQNMDYIFANEGIVKRYTTEELIKKALNIKEMLK